MSKNGGFSSEDLFGMGVGGGGLNGKGDRSDRALIDLLRLVSFSQHFLLI